MHRYGEVARLQANQLGLVSVDQLDERDVSVNATKHDVAVGRTRRVRRGVYAAVAVAPSYEQMALAAVLAIGENTFVSHLTAAYLWGLPLPEGDRPAIEVTTILERRPRLEGVRVHRSGLLVERDVTEYRDIPLAAPERVVLDCSSRLTVPQLGLLTDDALRRHLTTIGRIDRLLDRLRPAPGRSPSKVRRMLELRAPGVEDRESILEDFVYDALRRFAVPLPTPQHWVRFEGRRRRIDLCYVKRMLALEACGFEFRRSRSRFDDEALRGNELQLQGWKVLEFTTAFTDVMIAQQVARALDLPEPPPATPLTFAEWSQRG